MCNQFLPSFRSLLVLSIIAVSATLASAQSTTSEPPGGYYHVQQPFNVEHGFRQRHASTAHEGFLRGLSSYIQSLGVYEVHHAQASILGEQAEWLNYQNRKERVQSFYDRRRIRQDYMTEQREIAQQRDREGKQLLEMKRATEYRQAYKLTLQEFDPRTGQIHWPQTLRAEKFTEQRAQLDQLFAHRSQYNLHSDEYIVREIERAQSELKHSLRDARHHFAAKDVLAAQTFLTGLLYEAQYSAPLNS